MCYFISIAIPKRNEATFEAWRRRGYYLERQNNTSLMGALPKDYGLWTLTNGQCSCDLCKPVHEERSAVRLRADAVEIVRQLTAAIEEPFLYVHTYKGDIGTESLPVLGEQECDAEGLGTAAVREDILYRLRVRGARAMSESLGRGGRRRRG